MKQGVQRGSFGRSDTTLVATKHYHPRLGVRCYYLYTHDNQDAGWQLTTTNNVLISRSVTRDPYRRHLITAITNSVNGVEVSHYNYDYDLLNRVTVRNSDSFDYNARSEVIGATLAPNHTNRYEYDNIGNNRWTSLNSVTNLYTANELNQYTNIAYGVGEPLAGYSPLPLGEGQGEGSVALPCYDLDGNTLTYGVFSYTWDGENRLIAAYSNAICVVSNAYDHQSRRIQKITPKATHTYLYDDWNLVQEIIENHHSTTTNRYVWGKDISGTLQGAGGVGGLLAASINGTYYFPLYDNNGNITAYADEHGSIVAEYTYDAFGRTIAQSGELANAFPHRFSTKYYDSDTGLYYYGYRFYSPELMRWLSRDPIEEQGGNNVYVVCLNNCLISIDDSGLLPLVLPDPSAIIPDLLQWFTHVVEGCNPGEWYGGGWHEPNKSGHQRYATGKHVSFSHKCGVTFINQKAGITDGICNTAPTAPETDSRSRIEIYAENHDTCCERFRIWCNWSYKGTGHGGSKGNLGGLSIMPAWRKQNEIVFIKEGTPGYITRVSLDRPLTFEPPGEMKIPRGSRRIIFAISAYIHAGERRSIAEIEEAGSIHCFSMCINGH